MISYNAMIKQRPIHFFDKICLCPNCETEITSEHIVEEMSSVAVCPNKECNLKIYIGGS